MTEIKYPSLLFYDEEGYINFIELSLNNKNDYGKPISELIRNFNLEQTYVFGYETSLGPNPTLNQILSQSNIPAYYDPSK